MWKTNVWELVKYSEAIEARVFWAPAMVGSGVSLAPPPASASFADTCS